MLNTGLDTLLSLPPYGGYLYAYPHKTAYRKFDPPLDFKSVWASEDVSRLFLYVHIPFCEMRCGFCNLFTLNGTKLDKVDAYLAALRREADMVVQSLPQARFTQIAIGGGTPTYLNPDELDELFGIINRLSQSPLPVSIETSPGRTSAEHLKRLADNGVQRISLGVESFSQTFLKAMGRPEKAELSIDALDRIRTLTEAGLNIDLIYGAKDQTVADFRYDLEMALNWQPEEIFLYPLYVGNLTGLARTRAEIDNWDEQRLGLYRFGRDYLLNAGYKQISHRRFARGQVAASDYSCQEDGMIGLGAGARSYTSSVHYSWDYAVGRSAISEHHRPNIQAATIFPKSGMVFASLRMSSSADILSNPSSILMG